jgi:hypothetical protein
MIEMTAGYAQQGNPTGVNMENNAYLKSMFYSNLASEQAMGHGILYGIIDSVTACAQTIFYPLFVG